MGVTLPFSLLKAVRPRQWLKNLALFAPIIFTGQLFYKETVITTIEAFVVFCAVASSNYLFNDVMDLPKDRKHPFKKNRPVASGAVSPIMALLTSGTLLAFGMYFSYQINAPFFIMTLLFASMSYLYTLIFKHLAVVDILVIALGYFLRVYAGEAATGFHLSVWMSLAAFSLSLFLAIGKRRSELTLLQNFVGASPRETRTTLGHYSEKLLDTYTAMFANSTFISYAFYTFLERPPQSKWQFKEFIFDTFPPDRKWLMVTIPFVLFGIMRYMQLIYEGKGESPEKILTSDIPLISTIAIWGITAILIIYIIGG
ncbi:UbiA prenyltransferase family protein [Candidatus Gottesmanbacteria bacterium]|nr:UbiA prenyltransferase family protein [Candidatus Gottesmanbacteria bacterium]